MNIQEIDPNTFASKLSDRELLFFAIIGVQYAIDRGTTEFGSKSIDEIIADLTARAEQAKKQRITAETGIILE